MPSILAWRGADHQVVVGRVVGDVARCRRPSRCRRCGARGPACPGSAHGRASVSGSRRYGQNLGAVVGRVVRLGRELDLQVGQRRRRRGSATARSRWPGSRRRAGRPACGTSVAIRAGLDRRVEAVGRRARARRSAPAPRRCGRTSPAAGRPARSWSAGRWTARRAGCRRRPAAARATTREPDRLATSAPRPGPEVVVTAERSRRTPRRAPRRRRRSRPRPGRCARRSSCACDSSCRMSEAGVIG